MSTLRGSDGTLQYDSNAVGEFQDWELDISREEIETTASGVTSGKTFTLDIPGTTGRIRANADYGDTAQKALLDQVVDGAVPTPAVAQFRCSATKYFSGSILVTNARIVSQRGPNNVTVEFSVRVTGAIAVTWS